MRTHILGNSLIDCAEIAVLDVLFVASVAKAYLEGRGPCAQWRWPHTCIMQGNMDHILNILIVYLIYKYVSSETFYSNVCYAGDFLEIYMVALFY